MFYGGSELLNFLLRTGLLQWVVQKFEWDGFLGFRTRDVFEDGRLFIGIAVSHPDPETPATAGQKGPRPPTAVGFAANCKKFNCDVVGDFCFHDSRRTDVGFLMLLVFLKHLELFRRHRFAVIPS